MKKKITQPLVSITELENMCKPNSDRLEMSVAEMKDIYAERMPYTTNILLDGVCYIWSEAFIVNCRISMSTDSLSNMTSDERKIWHGYVGWVDRQSTSANDTLAPDGIGCTVPDSNGESLIVDKGGSTLNIKCDAPIYDVPKEDLFKSLDNVFMNILACLPYNECGKGLGDVGLVDLCPLGTGYDTGGKEWPLYQSS